MKGEPTALAGHEAEARQVAGDRAGPGTSTSSSSPSEPASRFSSRPGKGSASSRKSSRCKNQARDSWVPQHSGDMAGAGGGLGAWGPLTLLVLCSWTWPRAAAIDPVRNLAVGARTSSSITLVWEAPEGPASQNLTYWVQCIGGGDGNETQKTTGTSATVDRLDAATSYACSVWAEQDGASGAKEDLTVSTAPNAVRNLTVGARTNSSITLFWEPPEGPTSQGLTYWVQCIGDGGRNKTQNTASTSATVDGLDAGSMYELRVWVEKNGVSSSQETSNVTTAPSEVVDLQNMTQTNSSVTLRWTAPTDPHSQLYTYWVRWASEGLPQRQQDPQVDWANQMNKTSETSYEVQALVPGTWYNFSVWAERNDVAGSMQSLRVSTVPGSITIQSCVSSSGGYGVTLTWSCPLGGYEAFELQVGGQQLQQDRSTCNKGVSVSGLQPARSYRASVTTLWDGLRVMSTPTTCHTESGGVIAGAIVGVLLLLVLVGLLVFFLRRRKRKSQEKAVPKDLVFSSPGDILAGDFAHHVWRQGKDSNCGFAEEYQQLALEGQGQAQTVASAPENATKNRYRNVLPYDWSRVPLKPLHGEPGSDYINASFLPGLCSPREFIAAQGPLPHTVGDFWRLVWEQQSHTLVMLTNCMESGRVKCEHYWPLDAQPCTHGRLRVALVAEEVAENWAVRDLELLQLDEQQTLSVRQFHYLAWPDHGVPHSPDPLLDFWRMLRQWLDQTGDGGPPIVHCSAGVGRTGTLIALDVLLRQLESEGLLGPFRFVRKMRESRPLMVQTEAQYVFLHQCILRFLQRAAAAPAQEEATGDHVPDPIYENVAALQALEVEA